MLDELVTVQLDKERHMRLSLKGIIELKKLAKIDFFKGFNFKDASPENITAIIWACLIHEDKDLTYDDVLCMLDLTNYEAAVKAASVCLSQGLPETKAGKPPLARKSQRG